MARTNNLSNFLTDVADAIREKKGSSDLISASDFDTEIESITTGDVTLGKKEITTNGIYKASDDNLGGYSEVDVNVPKSYKWQRPSDWYDLPKMLSEAEPIEYEGKTYYPRLALQLMITNDETITLIISRMLVTVYAETLLITSDGQTIQNTSTSISITFDKSKDKATRYVMIYDRSPNSANQFDLINNTAPILEVVLGGVAAWNNVMIGGSSVITTQKYLRNFEMLDGTIQTTLSASYAVYNIVTLEHLKLSALQTGTSSTATNPYIGGGTSTLTEVELPNVTECMKTLFSVNYKLKRIYMPNLETTADSLGTCYSLVELIVPKLKTITSTSFLQHARSLETLSLPSIESGIPIFTNCTSLKTIELPDNFKISGWNLSYCYKLTKITLLDILNKLADVTEDSENTYSITLGTINLSKLSEDEIAIGTDKGWVIS